MTRKHDVIQNLIEASQHRKFARLYLQAYKKTEKVESLISAFNEFDAAFVNLMAAIRATIKPRPRRPKKML